MQSHLHCKVTCQMQSHLHCKVTCQMQSHLPEFWD